MAFGDDDYVEYMFSTGRADELLHGRKDGGSSNCYIATAVYGSGDCPQVMTLRRYRDRTLSATWYGRAFIRAYYAVSPALVKRFGRSEWFLSLFRPYLDRRVRELDEETCERM